MRRIALSVLAVSMISVIAIDTASAQRRSRDGGVTACSRYGNGCISAPVRGGRYGAQVRLPGGTWISCKRDCRETLREESVDFWETQRENAPDGYTR